MVIFRPNHGVRAYEAAVPALNANVRFPKRDELGDVAFLVRGGAGRESSVHRHQADGYLIATPLQHLGRDRLDEFRRICRHERRPIPRVRRFIGHSNFVQALERAVDSPEVTLDHLFALIGIGLADRFLDLPDGVVPRQDARQREKAGLQDCVGAASQPDLARRLRSIDHEKTQSLLDDLALHRSRQTVPYDLCVIGAVQ